MAAGFKVRAAARDVEQAKSNTDIAVQFGLIAPDQLSRLQWVEMDLTDPDSIRPAIGGAAKVGLQLACTWEGGGRGQGTTNSCSDVTRWQAGRARARAA